MLSRLPAQGAMNGSYGFFSVEEQTSIPNATHDATLFSLPLREALETVEGDNALYAACERGDQEIVKLLLERGADVNARGGQYGHALYAASEEGYLEIAQLLLEKGADIDACGYEDGTALYAASAGGHEKLVKLLLEKEADVRAEGGFYGNAVRAASAGGHKQIEDLLIEKGANPEDRNWYRQATQAQRLWKDIPYRGEHHLRTIV
ncbi:hypothetical protein CLIM01_10643 [Colletotrichum limetticola]|uniref:Ankyrin repeat protein n=1 Tax=Colletotrichum limetticola TaxID=1209924 RepID=A0ABQ9PIX4_9PEZI|nr:hypothetical protein CLIM01_10643 [Colletotrichum limetticola]